MDLRQSITSAWQRTLKTASNSTIYISDSLLSALYWSVSSHSLAKSATELFVYKSNNLQRPSNLKVVFLMSSHLSLHAEMFRDFIFQYAVTELQIITSVSQDLHVLELEKDQSLVGRYSQDGQVHLDHGYFDAIESKLLQWIKASFQNRDQSDLFTRDIKVNVGYEPLCVSSITHDLFLLPSISQIFPLPQYKTYSPLTTEKTIAVKYLLITTRVIRD